MKIRKRRKRRTVSDKSYNINMPKNTPYKVNAILEEYIRPVEYFKTKNAVPFVKVVTDLQIIYFFLHMCLIFSTSIILFFNFFFLFFLLLPLLFGRKKKRFLFGTH